jgi:RNA polymerase-binding transcription factor DksA
MDLPTQNHLATLRELLAYRMSELRADVHAAEIAHTPADVATAHDVEALRQVEAALHRLDDGVYGDCQDCGDAIPLQRLLVQPAVERCAACQAAHEGRLRAV